VAHGSRKKPLNFGGKSNHVTLGFGLGFAVGLRLVLGGVPPDSAWEDVLPGVSFV